jgi:hypothetical protein
VSGLLRRSGFPWFVGAVRELPSMVWTFFHLAIRLLLVPIGVGVGIGIGIDRVLLVGPHALCSLYRYPSFVSIVTMRSSKALLVAFPSGERPHILAGHSGWRRTPTRNRVQSRNIATSISVSGFAVAFGSVQRDRLRSTQKRPWRYDCPLAPHRYDRPSRHTRSMYGTHPVSRPNPIFCPSIPIPIPTPTPIIIPSAIGTRLSSIENNVQTPGGGSRIVPVIPVCRPLNFRISD